MPGRNRLRRANRPRLATSIGVTTNRYLLWGIASELVFTAALVYVPFLQRIFGTAALGPLDLALLLPFPFAVWGADELRRLVVRRRANTLTDR